MPTPTQKIASGLAQRERMALNRPAPFASLRKAPKNIAELKQRASIMFSSRDRLRTIAEKVNKAIHDERSKKANDLHHQGRIRSDSGMIEDTWDDDSRRKLLTQHMVAALDQCDHPDLVRKRADRLFRGGARDGKRFGLCHPWSGLGRFFSFLIADYKRWRLHLKFFVWIPADR